MATMDSERAGVSLEGSEAGTSGRLASCGASTVRWKHPQSAWRVGWDLPSSTQGEIRCLKLEEMVANKLKCLLQRRHVPDVYDLVHSTFINRDIAVNRQEVLTAFFRKTIYERSPGVACQLLLDLPLLALKTAWSKYVIAPVQGLLDFDGSIQRFQSIINELFAAYPVTGRAAFAYFPSHLQYANHASRGGMSPQAPDI